MTPRPDLHVEIWSARDAIHMIDQGKLGLPDFQRRFEWTSADVRAFLSTVLGGLPSGTLMVADNRKLQVELRELEGAPPLVEPHPDLLVLLDGQQRLTALYQAVTDTGPDRYAVDVTALLEGADVLQDEVIVSSTARSSASRLKDATRLGRVLMPLSALRDSQSFLAWRDSLDGYSASPLSPDLRDRVGDVFAEKLASISSYSVPVTLLGGDLDLATTAQVFERTNKWGQKLDAFDLMVARLRARGWSLREAWEETVSTHPGVQRLFGANGLTAVSAIALRELGDVRRSAVLSLDSEVVARLWDQVVEASEDVASALLAEGFRRPDLLPYDVAAVNMIALRMEGIPTTQLMQYVWRAGVNRRYEVASNSSVVSDFRVMASGDEVSELSSPSVDLESIERNSRRSNRALWASLVAGMLSLEPYDLLTGLPIATVEGISDDEWDLTSFIKGGGDHESEFDTPARLRTASQILYRRRTGSKLRTNGLRWVIEDRTQRPMLYGPSVEECLESQLLPRDQSHLFTFSPRELVRERAFRLQELIVHRGWGDGPV